MSDLELDSYVRNSVTRVSVLIMLEIVSPTYLTTCKINLGWIIWGKNDDWALLKGSE